MALIDSVLEWARTNGVVELLVDVANDNEAAVSLYSRRGFGRTGKIGAFPPPREYILEHQRMMRLKP